MLDDFQPIIHELEGRDIRLYPVADVHIGAAEAALPEFEAFLRKVKDDPDAYVCIVGDLLNNAVKSSVSDVYRETMSPSAAVDYAVEKLQPIADRILAIVGGNHERRSTKEVDLDPLYCVASMLRRSDGSSLQDIYRPSMAFMRVKLKRGRVKDTYAIMMTHGKSQAEVRRGEREVILISLGYGKTPGTTRKSKTAAQVSNCRPDSPRGEANTPAPLSAYLCICLTSFYIQEKHIYGQGL